MSFSSQILISRVKTRARNIVFSMWYSDLLICLRIFHLSNIVIWLGNRHTIQATSTDLFLKSLCFSELTREMPTQTEPETMRKRKILEMKWTSKLKKELSIVIRLKQILFPWPPKSEKWRKSTKNTNKIKFKWEC